MANNTINKNTITIVPVLMDHYKRYPLLKIQDIYKLIYQAAMGPEHLIPDKDAAHKKLCAELENITEFYAQPLFENIDPTEQLVRVNLNSFKQGQGDPEKLFEAFYQTSITFLPKVDLIKIYIQQAIHLSENKIWPFEIDVIKSFFHLKGSQNFPAVHHSDIYRKTYCPAYRLVGKNQLHLLN